MAACGEEPPSCQQAMTHYYGAQCVFRDGNTGADIPRDEMIVACHGVAAEIPGRCQDVFDDWLICVGSVEGQTDAGCDCSREFQALLACP